MSDAERHDLDDLRIEPERPAGQFVRANKRRWIRWRLIPAVMLVLVAMPMGILGNFLLGMAGWGAFAAGVRLPVVEWLKFLALVFAATMTSVCGLLAARACWKGQWMPTVCLAAGCFVLHYVSVFLMVTVQ